MAGVRSSRIQLGSTPPQFSEGRFLNLELVHVRGMIRRGLRLRLVAGLGIALGLLLLTVPAAHAVGIATTTTLTAQSSTQSCSTSGLTTTLTSLAVSVTGNSGVPSGNVTIEDEGSGSPVPLATVALSTAGQANLVFYLPNGPHTLLAVYAGNSSYVGSTSLSISQTISSQCDSGLAVAITTLSPLSTPANTLVAGESGSATVTVAPSQDLIESLISAGTPGFITVSCSGLPDESSCTFTPESLQISPGQYQAVTSTMVVSTQASGTALLARPHRNGRGNGVAWALLLPGMLGLGSLAWGTRRRRWLNRLMLLAMLGLVTTLGTTACNPRYYYLNHGPPENVPTPPGSYTVYVAAQYSNGLTAITQSTVMTLTVK